MFCWLCGEVIVQKLRFWNLLHPLPRICDACRQKLERVIGGCPNCGQKNFHGLCDDCRYWQSQDLHVTNMSLYYYNDFSQSLVHRIKYNGDLRLLKAFQPEICRFVRGRLKGGNIVMVPVPLHQKKFQQRGFNQAKIIGQYLPFPKLEVIKKNFNITQSQRSRRERLQAREDFSLTDSVDLSRKHVLIIDDIYTTGSTVHQIAECLLRVGARKISSFTLFRS